MTVLIIMLLPFLPKKFYQNGLFSLTALAVGTLITDATLHLIPDVRFLMKRSKFYKKTIRFQNFNFDKQNSDVSIVHVELEFSNLFSFLNFNYISIERSLEWARIIHQMIMWNHIFISYQQSLVVHHIFIFLWITLKKGRSFSFFLFDFQAIYIFWLAEVIFSKLTGGQSVSYVNSVSSG